MLATKVVKKLWSFYYVVLLTVYSRFICVTPVFISSSYDGNVSIKKYIDRMSINLAEIIQLILHGNQVNIAWMINLYLDMKDTVREVLKCIRCFMEKANPIVEKWSHRRIWVSPKSPRWFRIQKNNIWRSIFFFHETMF